MQVGQMPLKYGMDEKTKPPSLRSKIHAGHA